MGCCRALSFALSEKSSERRVFLGGFSLWVIGVFDLTHPLQARLEGNGGVSHGRWCWEALVVRGSCVFMKFTADGRGLSFRETKRKASLGSIEESGVIVTLRSLPGSDVGVFFGFGVPRGKVGSSIGVGLEGQAGGNVGVAA